jgi:uncharacterized protein YutE (UPF0331/DUF86 family)
MTPRSVSQRIVVDRLALVDKLLSKIQQLPLANLTDFLADDRNVAASESNLRRALEALMDVGRHILAKGFASGVTEYKEIVAALHHHQVLTDAEAKQMHKMAGYRNRLVHLYHEVSEAEIYEICTTHLADIVMIRNAYQRWLDQNPDKVSIVL